jgi:hypothetical protein
MAWVEPSTGNDLSTSEEVHTLSTVRVRVAKKRILPTTERVISNWDWYWNIDANHSNKHLILELSSSATIIGEDCSAISVLV